MRKDTDQQNKVKSLFLIISVFEGPHKAQQRFMQSKWLFNISLKIRTMNMPLSQITNV